MIRTLLVAFTFPLLISNVSAANVERDLRKAIENGEAPTVSRLLDEGASLDKPDIYGFTPLIWAATNDNIEILNLLIDRGADINFVNEDGGTALFYAVTNGKIKELQLLLDNGANPNVQFADGDTALGYAKARDLGEYPAIASVLQGAGATK